MFTLHTIYNLQLSYDLHTSLGFTEWFDVQLLQSDLVLSFDTSKLVAKWSRCCQVFSFAWDTFPVSSFFSTGCGWVEFARNLEYGVERRWLWGSFLKQPTALFKEGPITFSLPFFLFVIMTERRKKERKRLQGIKSDLWERPWVGRSFLLLTPSGMWRNLCRVVPSSSITSVSECFPLLSSKSLTNWTEWVSSSQGQVTRDGERARRPWGVYYFPWDTRD